MTEDDDRHGTLAGYAAHQRAGTEQCGPCREEHRRYNRERPSQKNRKRQKLSYIESGYDPDDGLKGGAWIVNPRTRIAEWHLGVTTPSS